MQGTWLLLFCTIGLLLWLPGQTQDMAKTLCDDKDVEAGVDLALVTHNGKLQQGNQLALYQIVGASKVINESTTLFNLEFLVRESDCPVGGDKVWRDCDYLPQANVAPSPCTASVEKSNLEESLGIVSVECKPTVEPVIVPSVARCLGCPEEIYVWSEDLKEPVWYSLAKFNAEDSSSHHFLLRDIMSARRQVVAGFRYDIQFLVEKSNCSKSAFKELTEECHPATTEHEFANCNATVYIAPWRREDPEAHMNCERTSPMMRFGGKRRPPGWSPLRHYFAAVPTTPLTTTQPPTMTLSEMKSSEEVASEEATSKEVTTQAPAPPVTDPGAATNALETTQDPALLLPLLPAAEPVRPFNCPTKPWKEFIPLTPPPPPQQESTPAPELRLEDGLFSDLDLLG